MNHLREDGREKKSGRGGREKTEQAAGPVRVTRRQMCQDLCQPEFQAGVEGLRERQMPPSEPPEGPKTSATVYGRRKKSNSTGEKNTLVLEGGSYSPEYMVYISLLWKTSTGSQDCLLSPGSFNSQVWLQCWLRACQYCQAGSNGRQSQQVGVWLCFS